MKWRGTPRRFFRLAFTAASLVGVVTGPADHLRQGRWWSAVASAEAEAGHDVRNRDLAGLGHSVQTPRPLPTTSDDRYAGLQWRFVRVKYHFVTEGTEISQDFVGEPWFIDAPAAEQNLSRRVKTATAIHVEDPIVMSLDDSRLFEHPWIYFVEPGTLRLQDNEVPILREFLLRGGTAMFDDFHGPIEWENFAAEMRRVFPNRPIVEVPKDHTVFNCFYRIDGYPQVAGIGSFMQGRTWEKGGFVPHLRTIYDDNGRPMMFINWNTDMGDGWEWSNVTEFPGYLKYTSMAYQMAINEIVYSLTH